LRWSTEKGGEERERYVKRESLRKGGRHRISWIGDTLGVGSGTD